MKKTRYLFSFLHKQKFNLLLFQTVSKLYLFQSSISLLKLVAFTADQNISPGCRSTKAVEVPRSGPQVRGGVLRLLQHFHPRPPLQGQSSRTSLCRLELSILLRRLDIALPTYLCDKLLNGVFVQEHAATCSQEDPNRVKVKVEKYRGDTWLDAEGKKMKVVPTLLFCCDHEI